MRTDFEYFGLAVWDDLWFDWFRLFFVWQKQQQVVPLVCGIVLMIFPYFVANTIALVLIGGLLCAVPWVVRI